MSTLLEVDGIVKHFGAVEAVDGVSFGVEEGQVFGLAGPNGAGKTVTFNCITGELKPDAGTVTYREKDITGFEPYEVVDEGMARTFQLVRIYPEMTVLDNMLFAAQNKSIVANVKSLLSGTSLEELDEENRERALELLDEVDMTRLKDEKAKGCSYGQKKILEFLNALMTYPEPDLILLDEPMAGVNPTMMNNLVEHIELFNERGKTFVIIEHNMRLLRELCDTMVVMDAGRKIAEGPPDEVGEDEQVVEAYFGE